MKRIAIVFIVGVLAFVCDFINFQYTSDVDSKLGDKKMQYTKPWYTLRIDAAGCPYDIRLNDCPIFGSPEGHGVITEFPVNKWMINGKNTVKITLKQSAGRDCKCDVTMKVNEFDAAKTAAVTILEVKAPGVTNGKPPKKVGEIIKEEKFEAKVPFPSWRWMSTKSIKLTDADRSLILAQARKFWKALSDKNIKLVQDMMALKFDETHQAHYQTTKESIDELVWEFQQIFDDPTMKISDFIEKDLEYRPFADGRLFYLVDSEVNVSPILFSNKEETIGTYIDLFFYRNDQGEWKIIR